MIAAIYARKSTEQNGVADDAKSVTRQIEHARTYAERKGWRVSEEHIYVDDGVSGAEFVKRPGLLRLMNALEPRPSISGPHHERGITAGSGGDRDRLDAQEDH